MDSTNGSGPDLEYGANLITEGLREQVAVREERIAKLRAEVEHLSAEVTRYRRALREITGEKQTKLGRPTDSKVRPVPSKAGPERIGVYRDAILRYAVDHEEFRQTDIRTMIGGPAGHSSVATMAFEQLRQEPYGLIRLARQVRGAGGGKFFRLTKTGLAELAAANEQGREPEPVR